MDFTNLRLLLFSLKENTLDYLENLLNLIECYIMNFDESDELWAKMNEIDEKIDELLLLLDKEVEYHYLEDIYKVNTEINKLLKGIMQLYLERFLESDSGVLDINVAPINGEIKVKCSNTIDTEFILEFLPILMGFVEETIKQNADSDYYNIFHASPTLKC